MTDPLDPDSKPENQPENPPPAEETPPPVEEEAPPVEEESPPIETSPAVAEATPSPAPDAAPTNVEGLHFPAMGQSKMSAKDEKFWGSLGHLLSLTGIFSGIGYVIGPLVPFLLKKGESPYVDEHTKETLNFSILTFICVVISSLGAVTSAPVLGCFAPLIPGLFIVLNLIFCIQGASAARDGKSYRYPFNWRIIK